MKQLVLVLLFTCWVYDSGKAQVLDNCREVLQKYTERMAKIGTPPSGKMHNFHFSIRPVSKRGGQQQLSTEIRVTITKKFYGYTSPQVSVFQDEQERFVVIHPQRKILRTGGSKSSKTKQVAFDQMQAIQQLALQQGVVSTCERRIRNGKPILHLALTLSTSFQQIHQVKSVEYWLNEANQTMKEVIIHYSSRHELQKQIVTYHELRINEDLPGPIQARDMVYSASGRVRARFTNYHIVDQ